MCARDITVLALRDYSCWGPTVSSRAGREPFPQQHVAQRQLAPMITTQLQAPLPCLSMGFNLSPAYYKCSIWHKSSNVLKFPPTSGPSPSQTRPAVGRDPKVLLQIHCSICSSLHQCHGEKHASIGTAPSHRTLCRVQAQCRPGYICTCLM